MWTSEDVWANPGLVLADVKSRGAIVEGLVPDQGITWMYAASMSFKTFVAMSLAAAVSRGGDWLGRRTEHSAVVYVGAEGGASLHVRRAGAELDAGEVGKLCVVTERPQLDTREGQTRLRGILAGIARLFEYTEDDDEFTEVSQKYSMTKAFDEYSVLVVIDTYSQTASGDDKTNVSAYVKGLRDMIEDAWQFDSVRLSFVVVDHATKAGGSYVGSVAKLNDVDSQIEVVRDGQSMRATLVQRKVKDGVESAPLPLELATVELPYKDAYGKQITTLVVKDGTRAAHLAKVAEGKAGLLLRILDEQGGRRDEVSLKKLFRDHPDNAGVKGESATRAYKRAMSGLVGIVTVENGVVTRTSET